MLRHLQARLAASKARQSERKDLALKELDYREEIAKDVQCMRELIADPRHSGYVALLTETETSLLEELRSFQVALDSHEKPLSDLVSANQMGRMQGKLQLIRWILNTPQALFDFKTALEEQGASPNGAGRHSGSAQSVGRSPGA